MVQDGHLSRRTNISVILVLFLTLITITGGIVWGNPPSNNTQHTGYPGLATTFYLFFNETGLPLSAQWTVSVTNATGGIQTKSSTSDTIDFNYLPGSYKYSITTIQGYKTNNSAGSVTILISNQTVNVQFYQIKYLLTFNEAGLPSGTDWSVFANNSLEYSKTNSILFKFPNGTYKFSVSSVKNYLSFPSNGSVTINGKNLSENITFKRAYTVSFVAINLPRNEQWGATLNGSVNISSSPVIDFSEPNGSYNFEITQVPGFRSFPSIGVIVVAGANVTQDVNFTLVKYNVTFEEIGLPVGEYWSVNLNFTNKNSITSFINFSEPNGTYHYKIGIVSGFITPENTGNVTVAGKAIFVTVNFTAVRYSVNFTETGLPRGTRWWINISRISNNSTTGNSLTFFLPNNTYYYTVSTSNKSFRPSYYTETFTVNGTNLSESIFFVPVNYTATFTEFGLYPGTVWFLNLSNGNSYHSGTNQISLELQNGTYGFEISSGNKIYAPSPQYGYFTVNGGNVSERISFYPYNYTITFIEKGLPSGTTWSVSLNRITESSSGSTIVFEETNGTYQYSILPAGLYEPNVSSGTLTVQGASVSVNLIFLGPRLYNISFVESGLPSGTSWSVIFNGTTQSSTTSTITFSVPNGTYSFTITTVSGYTISPSSGSITVNGGNINKAITFTPVTTTTQKYNITFMESGLPSGTVWYVNITGMPSSGPITSSSYSISLTNGSYTYSVSTTNKIYSPSYSNTFTVNGASVAEKITFTELKYSITFTESGLPAGTEWTVTLNGSVKNSTGPSLSYEEPNGTYFYSISGVPGYVLQHYSGIIYVNGTDDSILIQFVQKDYVITFNETGLPRDSNWSVMFDNIWEHSISASITFNAPNGSYVYKLGIVSGYSPSVPEGNVLVQGKNIFVNLSFSRVYYALNLTETGLPAGNYWEVTINGITYRSNLSFINLKFPNGTYNYSVASLNTSYTATVSEGSFLINGSNVTVRIYFVEVTYSVIFQEIGLPPGYLWAVNISGLLFETYNASLSVELDNGSYTYETYSINKTYEPVVYGGLLTVNGKEVNVTLQFVAVEYPVTFNEAGLPTNYEWEVGINGNSYISHNLTLKVMLSNGTYALSVYEISGYNYSAPDSFKVSGGGLMINITFSLITYTVTFKVPFNSVHWSVTIGGITFQSNGSELIVKLPNGSYAYTVHFPQGYTIKNETGIINISGVGKVISLSVVKKPVNSSYTLIIASVATIAAIITIILGLILRRRGRNKIIWK